MNESGSNCIWLDQVEGADDLDPRLDRVRIIDERGRKGERGDLKVLQQPRREPHLLKLVRAPIKLVTDLIKSVIALINERWLEQPQSTPTTPSQIVPAHNRQGSY